jgi:hypothetical protein
MKGRSQHTVAMLVAPRAADAAKALMPIVDTDACSLPITASTTMTLAIDWVD